MPLRWKIFLVFNFILAIPALICFIILLNNFLNTPYYNAEEGYVFVFLALFSLFAITFNGLLNTYVLQRFLPDKLMPRAVKTLYRVSLVLNILISVGLLAICIYGASDELGSSNDYEGKDPTGKIALAVLFFLWLIQVVVLIMQGQLPGLISRNHRAKMNSLIDSIGQ